MEAKKIKSALADVKMEKDPTLKSAKLASHAARFGLNAAWNLWWSVAPPSRF
jgi:hypothetical protein